MADLMIRIFGEQVGTLLVDSFDKILIPGLTQTIPLTIVSFTFAMIIATQGSILPSPVACGDPDLDITDALLQGLNSEYVKTKGKGEDAAKTE